MPDYCKEIALGKPESCNTLAPDRRRSAACSLFTLFFSTDYLASDESESADPLYRASQAAVRKLLEGVHHELAGEGIRACEVRLSGPESAPDQCGRVIRRALLDSFSESPTEVALHEIW